MSDSTLSTTNTATTMTDIVCRDSFLLRVKKDGKRFLVYDIGCGTVYGAGKSVEAALADWAKAVRDHIDVLERANGLVPHLERELTNYRAAITPGESK